MANKRPLELLCFVLIMLISTTAFAAPSQNNEDDEVTFSILPFLSPVALMKRFGPLREYLKNTTGKNIVLESAPSFPEYLRRTVSHQYDIVYTAPHYVPITLKDDHYQLLAASHDLAAHIVVRDWEDIEKIEQLAGKKIAHGPDQAFLVIIAKHLLKAKGLVGEKAPVFVKYKSHNAAIRAVTVEKEIEAAIIGTFLKRRLADLELREIAVTPFYPGIAILASKELPESFRKELAESFVLIKESEEGRETLRKIRFPGFKEAAIADFEALKAISDEAIDPNTFELIH